MTLQEHVDAQTYDKGYQDIECLNRIGYTESFKSWKNMKKLKVNWKGKVVCDLGCFHSYFGIKAAEEGAIKIFALDRHPDVLVTSQLLYDAEDKGDKVTHLQWEGGQPTPTCDIALVLNMLHHTDDMEETLKNIRCHQAIFEINIPEMLLISKYFKRLVSAASHRENRMIVFMEKL